MVGVGVVAVGVGFAVAVAVGVGVVAVGVGFVVVVAVVVVGVAVGVGFVVVVAVGVGIRRPHGPYPICEAHRRAARQSLASIKPLHGLALTALSPGVVDAWKAEYLKTHTQSSANTVIRYLKLWLMWAQEEGYLSKLPCKLKQEKVPDRERPIVELDQVEDFIQACDGGMNPQIPVAVRCAMMLGMREGEILRLRWQDVLQDAVIVHGKGGKIRRVSMDGTPVIEALTSLPRTVSGLVFPDANGKPHKQGWLRQALRRGCRALGIPTLGIHRLRATFATLHLRRGTPLKEVQQMMGHSDPRTTLIYQETSLEEQAKHQATLWRKRA